MSSKSMIVDLKKEKRASLSGLAFLNLKISKLFKNKKGFFFKISIFKAHAYRLKAIGFHKG